MRPSLLTWLPLVEYFFAALRYLKKKLKGNAESKDRDLLNFLRRCGNGARFSSVKYKNEITEFYLFNYVYLCNKFGRAKMHRLYANVCIKNCNYFHRTLLQANFHVALCILFRLVTSLSLSILWYKNSLDSSSFIIHTNLLKFTKFRQ